MAFYFEMFQDRYKQILYTITDSDGDAVDLSTVELIKWAGAESENSDSLIERSYPASGIQIIEAVSGMISITLSGVTLDTGTYYHESFYKMDGIDVHIDEGTFWVRPTII